MTSAAPAPSGGTTTGASSSGGAPVASRPPADLRTLLVGTYPVPEDAPGTGEGLWTLVVDAATGAAGVPVQRARATAPSFLAVGPGPDGEALVHAVGETGDGTLTTWTLTTAPAPATSGTGLGGSDVTLTERGTLATGGSYPCHVALLPGGAVGVANYGSGELTVVPAGAAGEVVLRAGAGTGPVADRQDGPHAHFVVVVDGTVWVSDLGADRIRRYAANTWAELAPITVPAGTGPRHVAVHEGLGRAYVVGELDARVHMLALRPDDDGSTTADHVGSVEACATSGGASGTYPSHVTLAGGGTRLLVGVRGPDVLAAFAVDPTTGDLTHLADTPLRSAWPRHHVVLAPGPGGDGPDGVGQGSDAGDVVLVAGQRSSTVEVLRVHPDGTGTPVALVDLPAPACLVELGPQAHGRPAA